MKNLKKYLGFVMAALMAFALTPTAAFAAGEQNLKIEGAVANHEYKVYQVLTGDLSALDKGEGTIANAKAGSSLKEGQNAEEVAKLIAEHINKGSEQELAGIVAERIDAEKPVATLTASNDSVAVPDGYYIIVDSYTGGAVTDGTDAISRYVVAVAGPTTVKPKVDAPSLDKKIVDKDDNAALDQAGKVDTAAIGDTIEYELTGNVPDMTGYKYYFYVVNDIMSKGLTFNGEVAITVGDKGLVKDADFTVNSSKGEDGVTAIEIRILDLKNLGVEAGASISVKYSATVNADAEIGNTANTNTAQLVYSNNPNTTETYGPESPVPSEVTGKTPESITRTYVTEIQLHKVNEAGDSLQGAEFTLTGEDLVKVVLTAKEQYVADENGTWYELNDGTYTETAPTDETASQYASTTQKFSFETKRVVEAEGEGANAHVVGTVDSEGYVKFTGLRPGTYTLKETKTPTGYNTMADKTIVIGATVSESGDIVWSASEDDNVLESNDGKFSFNVVNYKGLELPSTGGIGTTLFYVGGAVLIIGCVAFLITRRRAGSAK